MSTQGEGPEACVSLLAKLNILIYAIGEEHEARITNFAPTTTAPLMEPTRFSFSIISVGNAQLNPILIKYIHIHRVDYNILHLIREWLPGTTNNIVVDKYNKYRSLMK